MIIVMERAATDAEIESVVDAVVARGAQGHVLRGTTCTLVGVVGAATEIERLELVGLPGVERVMQVSKPYKLASAESTGGTASVLTVAGREVGGPNFTLIAGPCAVESHEQTLSAAEAVLGAGAAMFRGGVYKPRTSPYAFQGLGRAGLEILREAKRRTGLPIVTEVVDVREVETAVAVADVVQVGARNMQNYPLLSELGLATVPVLLKRGIANTLEELLMAAEYILKAGNSRVILCERGIRSFEAAYRFTLDLAAVPALKALTHLPVIIDPSHAAGRRELVEPLSLAAAAVGADGLIVEVHPAPEEAVCDGPQALPVEELRGFYERVCDVARVAGKTSFGPWDCAAEATAVSF